MGASVERIRRGLPRVPGGEPWPPIGGGAVPAEMPDAVAASVPPSPASEERPPRMTSGFAPTARVDAALSAEPVLAMPRLSEDAAGPVLRRGLPRVAGGEPWPPAGSIPSAFVAERGVEAPASGEAAGSASVSGAVAVDAPASASALASGAGAGAGAGSGAASASGPEGAAAADDRAVTAVGPAVPARGVRRVLVLAAVAVVVAGAVVLGVRALLAQPFMHDFLDAYPGSYALPAAAEPGFPAWVQWQHFFNFFLMALIIRTGVQVRTEARPTAFWAPRGDKGPERRISLALWLHQVLDVLWLLNGVVFVVLLFLSGHWMRIVPTSWEVLPNALSALLQYASLDWPTESGWANYNSLQQLMYFLAVFAAAPVSALTGIRLSGIWPGRPRRLSAVFPVETARALHFPVMVFFVGFIAVHVTLVLATGALRNLNHMFGGNDGTGWAGFWLFLAAIAVVAAALAAARPLIVAPIAGLFGRVTSR